MSQAPHVGTGAVGSGCLQKTSEGDHASLILARTQKPLPNNQQYVQARTGPDDASDSRSHTLGPCQACLSQPDPPGACQAYPHTWHQLCCKIYADGFLDSLGPAPAFSGSFQPALPALDLRKEGMVDARGDRQEDPDGGFHGHNHTSPGQTVPTHMLGVLHLSLKHLLKYASIMQP